MKTKTVTLNEDQWELIQNAATYYWDSGPSGEGWKSDELSSACSDLDAQLEGESASQQQWRPIETAPKDGTEILAIRVSNPGISGFYVTCWCRGEYWREMVDLKPTHWMPCPTPPTE